MRIVRAREDADFTVLPNSLIRDERLSYVALGLLTYFLHLPPGWEIGGIKKLAAAKRGSLRHEGRDVIAAALKELEQSGYLSRVKQQDPETGLWETVCEVRSKPADPADLVVKPQVVPSPGNPGPGKPGSGEPGPGQPGPGKPGHISKNFQQELKPPPTPPSHTADVAAQADMGQEEEAATEPKPEEPDHAGEAGTVRPHVQAAARTAAAKLVRSLKGVPATQRQALADRVAVKVAGGWEPDTLHRELSAGMGSAENPIAVYVTRLRKMPDTPPEPASEPQDRPGNRPESATEAQTTLHPYVDGGANGSCQTCARPATSSVHPQRPVRSSARCEHGRHPVGCAKCRSGVIATSARRSSKNESGPSSSVLEQEAV